MTEKNEPAVGSDDAGTPDEVTWHWLYADQAGVVMPGPAVAFESQESAEIWLREQFDALAESGVATVSLADGEHVVYGPMFLGPDGPGEVAEAEI